MWDLSFLNQPVSFGVVFEPFDQNYLLFIFMCTHLLITLVWSPTHQPWALSLILRKNLLPCHKTFVPPTLECQSNVTSQPLQSSKCDTWDITLDIAYCTMRWQKLRCDKDSFVIFPIFFLDTLYSVLSTYSWIYPLAFRHNDVPKNAFGERDVHWLCLSFSVALGKEMCWAY